MSVVSALDSHELERHAGMPATMKTYYGTSTELAAQILRDGFADGVVAIGARRLLGVALFERITDPVDAWLEVEIPGDLIAPYSVPGTPGEMRLWVVPARLLTDHSSRRLV